MIIENCEYLQKVQPVQNVDINMQFTDNKSNMNDTSRQQIDDKDGMNFDEMFHLSIHRIIQNDTREL